MSKTNTANEQRNIQVKELTVNVRCRDCVHFKGIPVYGKPCVSLGKLSTSKPCENFSLNPNRIDFIDDESSILLGKLLRNVDSFSIPKLAALLTREHITRKQGYSFGQVLYYRIFTADYLSNYWVAKVIFATKDWLYIQGKKGWRGMIDMKALNLGNYSKGSLTVLTEAEFETRKKDLIKAKKLRDPNLESYFKRSKFEYDVEEEITEDFDPSMIDEDIGALLEASLDEGKFLTNTKKSKKINGVVKVR